MQIDLAVDSVPRVHQLIKRYEDNHVTNLPLQATSPHLQASVLFSLMLEGSDCLLARRI